MVAEHEQPTEQEGPGAPLSDLSPEVPDPLGARRERRRRRWWVAAAVVVVALYALGAFDVPIVSLTGQNLGFYDCYRIGPYCTGPLSTSKPPASLLALAKSAETATPTPPESREQPADAARRQVWYLFHDQAGLAWDELHPAEQAVIPKSAFLQCIARTSSLLAPSLSEIAVASTSDAFVTVPRITDGTVAATNVTLTISNVGMATPMTQTRAEVRVGNTWRWLLDADFTDAYRRGECLAAEYQDATLRSGLYGRLDGSSDDACGLQRPGESVRQYVDRMKRRVCGGTP